MYYGSDARIYTLLLGAALAMVWSPWKLSPKIAREPRLILDAVGGTGLVLLVLTFVNAHYQSNFLFRGGFLLVALLSTVVIAVAVHPASRIGTVILAQQPLRWIGERSYGIYLWHWPIFMVTRPGFDTDITGWANTAMRIALTLVAAELSFRFVEEPIRHGSLGRWFRSLRSATGEDRSLMWQRTILTCSIAVVTRARRRRRPRVGAVAAHRVGARVPLATLDARPRRPRPRRPRRHRRSPAASPPPPRRRSRRPRRR